MPKDSIIPEMNEDEQALNDEWDGKINVIRGNDTPFSEITEDKLESQNQSRFMSFEQQYEQMIKNQLGSLLNDYADLREKPVGLTASPTKNKNSSVKAGRNPRLSRGMPRDAANDQGLSILSEFQGLKRTLKERNLHKVKITRVQDTLKELIQE